MRNLAPAFILTSIVALASGSALALGDMNKSKKSPNTETTVTTPASSTTHNTAPVAPNVLNSTSATTPSAHSETEKPVVAIGANGSTSASMNGSTSSTGSPGMAAGTTTAPVAAEASPAAPVAIDKDKSRMTKKQVAQADARCDSTKYPNRNDLPKDCVEKSGSAAAAATHSETGGMRGGPGAGTSSSVNANSPGSSK